MVVNKRKKNERQRGYKTHGYGSKKKHRGAGSRGGHGHAGTGKRADSKKPSFWKERYFGKVGFKKPGIREKITPVNISYLEENKEMLIANKLATEENGVCSIDLAKIGYNKLLSGGSANSKFRIIAPYASKKAIEKIKNAGGLISGLKIKDKEAKKDKKQINKAAEEKKEEE